MEQSVYMFVNRCAGGNRGKELLSKVPQPFSVDLGAGRLAHLVLYDMLEGESGDKPGFKKLKEATRTGVVRVVVAGGDGTILWAIEECEKHKIDTRHQVLIAVMPLGTGNDFSRFLGWGGSAPSMSRLLAGEGCKGLQDLLRDYVAATPANHDVWQVDLAVDAERGSIMRTGKEGKKEALLDRTITKLMHSYFSAGNDARAGMSQEKQRGQSRWGNLFNYGIQICLKGLPFREKEYVKDFARSMHHGTSKDSPLIFRGDTECGDAAKDAPTLVGNPQVLLVLNIPNCYGGFCRFWEAAQSVGVSDADPQLLKQNLDPSDGKLEVLTYGSILLDPSLAVARLRAKSIGAKRVFSGAPMLIDYQDDDEYDVYVHVQIDGEFFKLKNPTSTTFSLYRKIKVLHSRGLFFSAPSAAGSDADELSHSGSDSDGVSSISEDEDAARRSPR